MIRTERRPSPYAAEIILYRTRTDILTDRRIIANDTILPLSAISKVHVSPTRFHMPLQVARLLALLAALALASVVAGLTGPAPTLRARLVTLILMVGAGAFVALAPRYVPTHRITMHTQRGVVHCCHSHDLAHLRDVIAHIDNAITRITQNGRNGDVQVDESP
jgi:hypothetical protein